MTRAGRSDARLCSLIEELARLDGSEITELECCEKDVFIPAAGDVRSTNAGSSTVGEARLTTAASTLAAVLTAVEVVAAALLSEEFTCN